MHKRRDLVFQVRRSAVIGEERSLFEKFERMRRTVKDEKPFLNP
jgi:hypothetical protein